MAIGSPTVSRPNPAECCEVTWVLWFLRIFARQRSKKTVRCMRMVSTQIYERSARWSALVEEYTFHRWVVGEQRSGFAAEHEDLLGVVGRQ